MTTTHTSPGAKSRTTRIVSAAALTMTSAILTVGSGSGPAAASGPADHGALARTWDRAVTAVPKSEVADVTAVSETKFWTFGTYVDDITNGTAVAAMWNGKKWRESAVKTPRKATSTFLSHGSATSKKDVWAAGHYTHESGAEKMLVERWNGKKWKLIRAKNAKGSPNTAAYDIVAVAPDDVWLTGAYIDEAGQTQPMVQHYTGRKFTFVDFPKVEGSFNSFVTSLDAIAADDIWAAGTWQNETGVSTGFTAHWDGSQWSLVDTPNPPTSPLVIFWSVSALATDDVWVAGFDYTAGFQSAETLTLHWDGTQWALTTTVNPSPIENTLLGVQAFAPDDVWAVGNYVNEVTLEYETLAVHYDGTSWTRTDTPNVPEGIHNFLRSVDGVDADHLYAGGYWLNEGYRGTAIGLSWDGSRWAQLD